MRRLSGRVSMGCIVGVVLAAGLVAPFAAQGESFSFAVLADPHIDGNSQHEACLEAAVRWIVTNGHSLGIQLVFIVGDIAWGNSEGHSNLETAKGILDRLTTVGITYVPIIGDNEVHAGFEAEFDQVFGEQYTHLSTTVQNWRRAPTPVGGMHLQNFSFDYGRCHFVCPDFAPRVPGHEGGELHSFAGGSWPWFADDIVNCPKPKPENVVILTHIGMFRIGTPASDQYLYSESDLSTITDLLIPYRDAVAANCAGHVHEDWVWSVPSLSDIAYTVYVTDETWYDARWPESHDDSITVRWVSVDDTGPTIQYTQHLQSAPVDVQKVPAANLGTLLIVMGFITLAGVRRLPGPNCRLH